MATDALFPAAIALPLARRIVDELRALCVRIEIAGSLRRKVTHVHDIDIVLLPMQAEEFSLNEAPLDAALAALVERGSLTRVQGKDKVKRFVATKTGIPVDLYIATAQTWATLLLIRTGSKDHNVKLAMRAREQQMKLRASGDGIEGSSGQLIRVNSEQELFALLGMPYLEPKDRR